MKFKDIVNRDIVNLDNCEQEPIHIPGSIQPHGFLIGITADTWIIDYCSGNIVEFIGKSYNVILNKSFTDIFGVTNTDALKKYISSDLMLSSTLLRLEQNSYSFLCTVHKSDDIYIIEAEPYTAEEKNLPDTYEQTRQFLTYISETSSLQSLCQLVAQGTRELTGYDRVMVYRFDEEYNGEVFAEAVREDLEPFFGLHYPHTDIPVQARALYMRNLLRQIGNMDYIPVPIYTVDNKENKNLDLSLSILRSTSPIHVQYLQNMGVGATLTISLIHKNRLWGLIACHHYSAKTISHPVRIAAQLQGHFITSQIDLRQNYEEYNLSKYTNTALEQLLSLTLSNTDKSYNEIIKQPQLLQLCGATRVCIYMSGILYCSGKLPDEPAIKKIITCLSKKVNKHSFITDNLSAILPEAKDYCDSAAGVIYHSLSIANDNCIIWFRPETIKEINWAGDPIKAIIKDENGLHPRKSFTLWQELIKCRSKKWEVYEINTAASYAHTLQKHATYISLTTEEEKYRTLSIALQQSNDELENVNWISTHDLQEPLRKIQMMASRILGGEEGGLSAKNHDMVIRMNDAAHRMQTLLKDILAYSKVRNTESLYTLVDMEHEVAEALQLLDDFIKSKGVQLHIDKLPEIEGIAFLIKQLFTNLINNAIKFSDPERDQVITISAETVMGVPEGFSDVEYHKITITDTGIGFEQGFADKIFKIFTRLHNRDDYEGSGVGLALCKKIMEAHNGYTTASGTPNVGASFEVYFPVKQ